MNTNLLVQQAANLEPIRWIGDMFPLDYNDNCLFNLSQYSDGFKFSFNSNNVVVRFDKDKDDTVVSIFAKYDSLSNSFAGHELKEIFGDILQSATDEAIVRANALFGSLCGNQDSHVYLSAKDSYFVEGIKVSEGLIYIPIFQSFEDWESGKLTSYQYINTVGVKKFPKSVCSFADFYNDDGTLRLHVAGPVGGGFFPMGFFENPFTIFVVEGYATGTTVAEATGCPVVVAFNAGNLLPVAKKVSAKYPLARIVVAADRDSVGQAKAKLVVDAVLDSVVAIPVFSATWSDDDTLTDFNDLKRVSGLETVKSQLLPLVININHVLDPGIWVDGRKYLSELHIDEVNQTRIIMAAPVGSGKTYSIKYSNIKELVDKGFYVVFCLPRVSLVDYYVNELKKVGLLLKHYSDGITINDHAVVTCINSFGQMPRDWPVERTILVLDESDLSHQQVTLMLGPDGRSLQDAHVKLASFIHGSHCVISCNANITSLSLDVMARNSGSLPLTLIDFERKPYDNCYMIELPSVSSAFDKVRKVLEGGGRVLCATSSKKVCTRIRELGIAVGVPEAEIMAIYRENKNDPAQKLFLQDINEEVNNHRLVAYSPVVTGGLSFDDTTNFKPFDMVIGIFKASPYGSSPYDWVQQLARYRQPTNMYVCLDTPLNGNDYPLRSQIIDSMEINTRELPVSITDDISANMASARNWPTGLTLSTAINRVVIQHSSFLQDKVTVMLAGNFARVNARDIFLDLVTKMGFIFVKDEITEKEEGRELLECVKASAEERRIENIVDALPVSSSEAVKILQSYNATEREICAATKRNLQDFYGSEVTTEIVFMDNDGELRRQIWNALIATATAEELCHKEFRLASKLIDGEIDALLVKSAGLRKSVFHAVLGYAGYVVTDSRTFEWQGNVDIAGFIQFVTKNKKRVAGILTVREDYRTNPIQLMNSILDKMGLKLVCSNYKKGGVKLRKYIANENKVAIINEIVLKQLANQIAVS